jgi:hypothetical protein
MKSLSGLTMASAFFLVGVATAVHGGLAGLADLRKIAISSAPTCVLRSTVSRLDLGPSFVPVEVFGPSVLRCGAAAGTLSVT